MTNPDQATTTDLESINRLVSGIEEVLRPLRHLARRDHSYGWLEVPGGERQAAALLAEAIWTHVVEIIDIQVAERMAVVETVIAQAFRDHVEQAPHIYPDGSSA